MTAQTRIIMGMPITIAVAEPVEQAVIDETFDLFVAVDEKFSTYRAESEISRFNKGELRESDLSADMHGVFALARHWSVIQIGQAAPHPLAGWRISTKEFREDLQWATIVPGPGEMSKAVMLLLGEMANRGIAIQDFRPGGDPRV